VYYDDHVCLSVCLSVRSHIADAIHPKVLTVLIMALTLSFFCWHCDTLGLTCRLGKCVDLPGLLGGA